MFVAGTTVYTCILNQLGLVENDLTVSMVESGDGAPYSPKFEGKTQKYVAFISTISIYVQRLAMTSNTNMSLWYVFFMYITLAYSYHDW